MKKLLTVFACLLVLALCFTACAPAVQDTPTLSQGGVLYLSVNPEIAVSYDADGNVTKVEARNADAVAILANYTGYEGKTCKTVVSELVTEIGNAGYFVEEIEGERRRITIEIEPGSKLPSGTFLEDVTAKIKETVDNANWTAPVETNTPTQPVRICTNPYCKDLDCDDIICDAGECTNPYCNDVNCDDADCDDNIPQKHQAEKRTCTNPYCKDDDCDDRVCDAGVCTNPYCDDWDCDDADCDDNIPQKHQNEKRTCTNPYCKDNDCDDVICDAGVCTNPYCDDWDCDDADCDDNIPKKHQNEKRTCTNPYCKDDDCDDRVCDAGVCTNPYCDEWDCDDADCDDDDRYDDDD